jgi:hypothetical protein
MSSYIIIQNRRLIKAGLLLLKVCSKSVWGFRVTPVLLSHFYKGSRGGGRAWNGGLTRECEQMCVQAKSHIHTTYVHLRNTHMHIRVDTCTGKETMWTQQQLLKCGGLSWDHQNPCKWSEDMTACLDSPCMEGRGSRSPEQAD